MTISIPFSILHNIVQQVLPSSSKTFHHPPNRISIPLAVAPSPSLWQPPICLLFLETRLVPSYTHANTLCDLFCESLSLGIMLSWYTYVATCLNTLLLVKDNSVYGFTSCHCCPLRATVSSAVMYLHPGIRGHLLSGTAGSQ